jgi:redox-regulated HSP33 family molecular chaperone
MGTITKRKTKDGKSTRYTATVRIQRQTMPKSLEEYVNSLKKTG